MNTQNNDDGISFEKLDDILLAKIQPIPDKCIFFHETSCPKMPPDILDWDKDLKEGFHLNVAYLNARQACAVESAALHNPSTQIFVLFASPRYKYLPKTSEARDPVLEAILSYDNVHLRNLNLWTYAANTSIYEWLKHGALFESSYVAVHLADLLRFLTLWRWGGTHLDLDIVMLKTMEKLPPNYTGTEFYIELSNSVMNFASDGFGHNISEQCLQDFQREFDGKTWSNNGPGVITRVMRQICGTENIKVMMNSTCCMDFKVYPTDAFYAIPYTEWSHFFETHLYEQTMKRTQNSYLAHFWNKLSKKRSIEKGKKCAYSALAEKHCPQVFQAAGKYF